MTGSTPKVRIRMYRQGLGDCFLLTFDAASGPVHMLVDCGTLGARTTGVDMTDVVADIKSATGNHLHLLVATHEHQDHLSGFNTEHTAFAEFQVDNVWVAWTENPADELAREVKKFNGDLLSTLLLAGQELRERGAAQGADLGAVGAGIGELLDFYGDIVDGGLLGATLSTTVNAAMSYVTRRANKPPEFLDPGRVIEPPWLPGVRFYVLGPPRSQQALAELGDHESPELYHMAGALSRDLAGTLAFAAAALPPAEYRDSLPVGAREQFATSLPFDPGFRIEAGRAGESGYFTAYLDEKEAWRRIDHDWLRATDDLALQLDNATNNTSLVLAIELIDDNHVLLLPGDAQLGNWRSWKDVAFFTLEPDGTKRAVDMTTERLLNRTVFYKVGHHASHNATMKAGGLESMISPDLVAMVPVDRAVALGKRPNKWFMPADALFQALVAKTNGRVVRSDTGWDLGVDPPTGVVQETLHAARDSSPNIEVAPLFIEYRLH